MDNRTADQLIQKTGQGDKAAFEELYNGLSKAVYAFAFSILKNEAAAQDVMQDTFVRVYRHAKSFTPNGSGVAWIMRIARNLCATAASKPKHEPMEEIDRSGKNVPAAEESAVGKTQIAAALELLGESERRIITLHAVSGLTLKEISQVLDEPLGTVKWRHAQALRKMKKLLGEEV